jgi:hypothetical protein
VKQNLQAKRFRELTVIFLWLYFSVKGSFDDSKEEQPVVTFCHIAFVRALPCEPVQLPALPQHC